MIRTAAFLIGASAIAAAAAGCATAVATVPEPFPGAIRVTAGTSDVRGLAWSVDRRLRWSDFQGTPLITSGASAVTAYVINYEGECTGADFTFTVTTTFLPDRSWVKPGLMQFPVQAAQALQHEQTHFDLGEIHARKIRRTLAALPDACTRPEADLNAFVRRLLDDDNDVQRKYDRETAHGTDEQRQAEWDAVARRELSASRPAIGGRSAARVVF